MLSKWILPQLRLSADQGKKFVFSLVLPATMAVGLFSGQCILAFAQNQKPPHESKTTSAEPVARGKYLVEGVAMCGQCHTPTDSNGNPDRTRWLQGGSLPWLSAKPNSDWPLSAPRIGGTPPANDADMAKLLMTGVWTTGNRLRSPMPQFRMERGDAEAVVAYLKSLTPQQ
jgi:mono/diheme cytochrome c family protein